MRAERKMNKKGCTLIICWCQSLGSDGMFRPIATGLPGQWHTQLVKLGLVLGTHKAVELWNRNMVMDHHKKWQLICWAIWIFLCNVFFYLCPPNSPTQLQRMYLYLMITDMKIYLKMFPFVWMTITDLRNNNYEKLVASSKFFPTCFQTKLVMSTNTVWQDLLQSEIWCCRYQTFLYIV